MKVVEEVRSGSIMVPLSFANIYETANINDPIRRANMGGLTIDELDFILAISRQLGLDWQTVRDVGSSLVRSILVDVPILNVERELTVRLKDQSRAIAENDLREQSR